MVIQHTKLDKKMWINRQTTFVELLTWNIP